MLSQSSRAEAAAQPSDRPTGFIGDRFMAALASRLPGRPVRWSRFDATCDARPTRRMRLLAIPALVAALAACGGGDDYYYDDPACDPANYPAVAVRFVEAATLRPITIGALGTVFYGRVSEEMTSPEPGYAVDGRTSVLEGAFGRVGVFDVSVVTRAGERYDWTGVQVHGDYCQIYTAYLEARVHYPDP